MSLESPRRAILTIGATTTLVLTLCACGQKGALYIPDAPAATQRATLPQTVFGGRAGAAATPASSVPPPAALPDLPDIQ